VSAIIEAMNTETPEAVVELVLEAWFGMPGDSAELWPSAAVAILAALERAGYVVTKGVGA
jgi:hypothetical protein